VGRHDVDAALRPPLTDTQLAALFERQPLSRGTYRSQAAELRAVARGKKPMSLTYIGRRDIAATVAASWDLGLASVLARAGDDVAAFAVGPDAFWRVSALLTLEQKPDHGPWTHHATTIRSRLLGYSEREVADYIAAERRAHAGYELATLYFLLTRQQLRAIRATSARWFPTEACPLFAFQAGKPFVVPKRRPPLRGMLLARAGVEIAFARELLGQRRSITIVDARGLNRALETNIGVWSVRGWQ
jgi:hypothetical protein